MSAALKRLSCWMFGHYWCFRVGRAGEEYGTMAWGRACGMCDAFKPDPPTGDEPWLTLVVG